MKKKFKICKNPDCKKKFYKDEITHERNWKMTFFHSRECQTKYYNKNRGRSGKYTLRNAINFQAMHDACNRYNREARKRLKEQVTIYSSEDMTQEELQALIPSMGGRR